MPQMAPMMWMSMFFIFSLIFIIFNMINYFNFILNNKKLNKKLLNKNFYLNWKW